MGRITWVCATCAQHFTRRYSANRHNSNLHNAKGIIVRLLDYIVGRLDGNFLSNDPLSYRRKKEIGKKNALPCSNYHINNNNFRSKVNAHSMSDILAHESAAPERSNNSSNRNANRNNSSERSSAQPMHEACDNKLSFSDDLFNKMHERKLKLEQFKIKLNKYYPRHIASEILASTTYLVTQENDDDFLDKMLHDIDRTELYRENAFDKSVGNNTENRLKPNPRPLDFSMLQPTSENRADQPISADMYKEARAKLKEIEGILSPFCPPEFVRDVIRRLIEKCKMGGNYDILNEALENHRNNVIRFYSRY
jgi:hypothetical protein